MKLSHLITGLLLTFSASSAFAETWIARCNNLQFNFNKDNSSYLVYFKTTAGIFQIAKGDITFDNGVVLRGPVDGNGFGNDGKPITQIGLNPSRKIVYVFYQHPYNNTSKSGTFCKTSIQKVL